MYISKTRKQFIKFFREEYLPGIKNQEKQYSNGADIPLRRENWNNIIDALVSDRSLPQRAIDWSSPW